MAMSQHYVPIKMAKTKRLPNVSEYLVTVIGLSYIVGGSIICYTTWKTLVFIKLNIYLPYHPAIQFIDIYSREIKTYIHIKIMTK